MAIQWLVLYITLLNHGKHAHMIRLIVIAEENTNLFSFQKKSEGKNATRLQQPEERRRSTARAHVPWPMGYG
jgi:hypothetical protein